MTPMGKAALECAVLLSAVVWSGGFARAQTTFQAERLAPGKLLVATKELPDPNFGGTVVLLIKYDSRGAMGLILNRQTDVPLSEILELKGARTVTDPVYVGGPVGRSGVLALARFKAATEGVEHVFSDIYLATSRTVLEQILAEHFDSTRFRVYLGYSGWGPGQLEREVKAEAWHIFAADEKTVFDPEPKSMWRRLIRRTELRLAGWTPRPAAIHTD
jgi:putative transcriptional regulator